MNVIKRLRLVLDLLIVLFIIKGILADFGFGVKYPYESIYSFAYLGFAMSAFLFFDKYILQEDTEEESNEV